MSLNTFKMWSNDIKIAFFSKKLQKIAQRMFELHWFTLHVSQFRHFHFLTIDLSPLLLAKFWFKCQTRPRLLIFHSSKSLPQKSFSFENFWWPLCMMRLVVWAPPPNQNSWLCLCETETTIVRDLVRDLLTVLCASKLGKTCVILNYGVFPATH